MSLVFLALQFFASFSEGFFALGVFIKQLAVLAGNVGLGIT